MREVKSKVVSLELQRLVLFQVQCQQLLVRER